MCCRDHRKLGQELDLFSIESETAGGGLVFWHPNGAAIRNILENFWKVPCTFMLAYLSSICLASTAHKDRLPLQTLSMTDGQS